MLAQRGERAQNGSKAVRGKSAQKQGKEKTANEGGLELADGYTTESGRPLSRQTKKDRLIYSSPGLGAATVSGNSAVSHDDKAGAANRGGSPTSDKSGDLDTSTISPEEAESKENSLYEDEQAALKGLSIDAKGVCRLYQRNASCAGSQYAARKSLCHKSRYSTQDVRSGC